MTAFINEVMLQGAGNIVSAQPATGRYLPVVYVTGNPFASAVEIAREIARDIHMGRLKPDDVIVQGAFLGWHGG